MNGILREVPGSKKDYVYIEVLLLFIKDEYLVLWFLTHFVIVEVKLLIQFYFPSDAL